MLNTMTQTAVRLRLAEILKERGMMKLELVERSGLNKNTVTHLLHNPAMIRMETIAALCEALNITPGELFIKDPPPA